MRDAGEDAEPAEDAAVATQTDGGDDRLWCASIALGMCTGAARFLSNCDASIVHGKSIHNGNAVLVDAVIELIGRCLGRTHFAKSQDCPKAMQA